MPDGVEVSSYTHRVVRMPDGKTKSVTEAYYNLPAPGQVPHHQTQQQYGYPSPYMPGHPMFQQPYMGYANEHHSMSHTAPQDVPAFTPAPVSRRARAPALALPAPKAKRRTTKNSGNGKAAETSFWDRATFDAIIGGKAPPVMPTPPAEENAATSTGPGPAFSNMAVPVTSTNEKVALSIKEEQSLRARPASSAFTATATYEDGGRIMKEKYNPTKWPQERNRGWAQQRSSNANLDKPTAPDSNSTPRLVELPATIPDTKPGDDTSASARSSDSVADDEGHDVSEGGVPLL